MEYIKTVCKIGQGEKCCRYLTVGPGGFNCEKLSPLKEVLDQRLSKMVAQGDNCEGKPAGEDLSKITNNG